MFLLVFRVLPHLFLSKPPLFSETITKIPSSLLYSLGILTQTILPLPDTLVRLSSHLFWFLTSKGNRQILTVTPAPFYVQQRGRAKSVSFPPLEVHSVVGIELSHDENCGCQQCLVDQAKICFSETGVIKFLCKQFSGGSYEGKCSIQMMSGRGAPSVRYWGNVV